MNTIWPVLKQLFFFKIFKCGPVLKSFFFFFFFNFFSPGTPATRHRDWDRDPDPARRRGTTHLCFKVFS